MLAIEKVSVAFGGLRALREVSMVAEGGSLTAVIGANGAGKSTLMNVISGYLSPASGSVAVNGKNVTALAPHDVCRAGIARTFQNLQMFTEMTALEVIVTGRHKHFHSGFLKELFMLPPAREEERRQTDIAIELLERLQIASSYWSRRAGDLPYGIQRRLEIARALATEPGYLLLDEPAAGLNDDETEELGSILRSLLGSTLAVILIEHDIGLVMKVSDHIYVMDAGAVIASGAPDQIRSNPEVIEAYLGDSHAV